MQGANPAEVLTAMTQACRLARVQGGMLSGDPVDFPGVAPSGEDRFQVRFDVEEIHGSARLSPLLGNGGTHG